jgi:hypothetical protein
MKVILTLTNGAWSCITPNENAAMATWRKWLDMEAEGWFDGEAVSLTLTDDEGNTVRELMF